jgi:hypothetical protein
MGILT